MRSRWLEAGGNAVAVGWLVWLMASVSPGFEPLEQRARVRPAPLPEVAAETSPAQEPAAARMAAPERPPEPEKVPEAQAAPEPAPAPTTVQPGDLSQGAGLLDGGGSFPALSASYQGLRSFATYADAMQRLGARFVVVRQHAIAGEIDPLSGRIREGTPRAAFSPRARDYSGEPALARASASARARYGADAVVMMLVPRDLDAGLFGGIARALSERGAAVADYRELSGRYELGPGGTLRFRIETGVRRDGSRQALPLLFDLGAIARSAGTSPRA